MQLLQEQELQLPEQQVQEQGFMMNRFGWETWEKFEKSCVFGFVDGLDTEKKDVGKDIWLALYLPFAITLCDILVYNSPVDISLLGFTSPNIPKYCMTPGCPVHISYRVVKSNVDLHLPTSNVTCSHALSATSLDNSTARQ